MKATPLNPTKARSTTVLKVSGWDKSRRVVVLRRAVKTDLALSRKAKNEPGEQTWEYAVLVINSAYALDALCQLYRVDCEKGFDELKNQWVWGALRPRTLSASRAVRALLHGSVTGGAGTAGRPSRGGTNGGHHPPSVIAGRCGPGGQTYGTLYLMPMHGAKGKLLALIANIRAALGQVRAVAEQLPRTARWKTFLNYVVAQITVPVPAGLPPNQRMAVG